MQPTRRKRILLVEDEALIAMVEARRIAGNGYEVVSVHSGERAVEVVEQRPPFDLILMDIDLGDGIDGTEAARRILRQHEIPIVFLTSHGEQEMVEKVRDITRFGYVLKGTGDFVLLSSIEMAFELSNAHRRTKESEEQYRGLVESITDVIYALDENGTITYISPRIEGISGFPASELHGRHFADLADPVDAGDLLQRFEGLRRGLADEGQFRFLTKSGASYWVRAVSQPVFTGGSFRGVRGILSDITERKRVEEALQKRIIALTQPLEEGGAIAFADLFNLDEIQSIQDAFASATGVASIITLPDGTPLTRPSNFCRLCNEVIRKTELGRANCYTSDAVIGCFNPKGPTIQPCLSGGLWDAGASINVGGRHIANWLIGQVQNDAQDHAAMMAYAGQIGADPVEFSRALDEVPVMSRDRFEKVARALFLVANELSLKAYQNVLQARVMVERRGVEEALRAEEERFRVSALCTGSIIYDYTPAGGEVNWSGAVLEVTGWLQHDFAERGMEEWTGMVHPEDRVSVQMAREAGIREAGRFEVIYRFRRADNTIITVQEIGQAVPGSDGRGARILGAIRDITARVRAEEEVRESAHKYRMLFDGAHDAIFLLRDLSIVDCSAHAEVLFGAPTASLLGRSIEAFSPPLQPDGQPTGVRLAPLARAALGGEPQFFEWRHVRADGTEFDAEVSLKAIVLAGVHHLQAIVRDITDRKRAAESAKTILLQKETLLREAHHRIKNNLATVASLLSLQADRVQDPGSCGTLRDACNRVRTMSAIYEKLFSSQSYTVVDLRPYLSGLIEALARAYVVHRDRVVLSSAIEEGVVPVRSAFPLGLIVNEIVTNALKHAFPEDRSGRVDVSVRAVADGKLEVVIADDGIGLPARARERQAPGFGLDLVEVMVAQIEGTLSVENRSGTRYTITFVP